MYSINFSKPSIGVFGGADCHRPCKHDGDWMFRMRHCFIAEVFDINEVTGAVKQIMKVQCVGYRNMNPDTARMFRAHEYGEILDVIQSAQVPMKPEVTAIVEQIVIDRNAPIGSIIDVVSKLHCVLCQCMAFAFGDFRYFAWYMNRDKFMPTVNKILDSFMCPYDKGDIRHNGDFYYKIPWDNNEDAPQGEQVISEFQASQQESPNAAFANQLNRSARMPIYDTILNGLLEITEVVKQLK